MSDHDPPARPRAGTAPTRRPPHQEPGLVLTAVLLAYSALVFAWWPTDTEIAGVSLVTWLMLVGIIAWVVIGFVYCWWTERLDRAGKAAR
ncbi:MULTISPECIES: hypothetical protein [unclassified Serinicoccus]|uniref:hypothetical protein n=1 Tax=unclassified Serinicoccus TaxID=2643101 RepID=UPI003851B173